MKSSLIYILVITLSFITLTANVDEDEIKFGKEYIFKLKNGDLVSGTPDKFIDDDEFGRGISIYTELGQAVIFLSQIDNAILKSEYYRHAHRVYLLPTAVPIGDDHFIGNFELLFFYGGFGIMDKISFTFGRSVIPTLPSEQQISEMNLKFSVLEENFQDFDGKMDVAVGGNLAFVNHDNRLIHAYAAATFQRYRSSLTTAVFYKAGSKDLYRVQMDQDFINMPYEDGAIGLGLGLDTKFTHWHGIHFIGELWNSNIAKPQNTGVLLGLRINNTNFSADFGLALFTAPFGAPFISFVWTPF